MNARPTTIRLDQPTLDRAATMRDAQRVPVSLSAVLQEAIRRGLASMESEWDKAAGVGPGYAISEATTCEP